MTDGYLLSTTAARRLYNKNKDLPIIDYHCHLSPREIYEDLPFKDIAQLWLGGDHYKWRLMRAAGIEERLITGDADGREKFAAYAYALSGAAGSPLYHWTAMELDKYFGITRPLCADTADLIYDAANKVIAEKKLSPRKLIESSGVEYIATTDDAADSLEYHEKLAADNSFKTKVTPSFRCDKLLLANKDNYKDYIARLSAAAGLPITDFASLLTAVGSRLDYFVLHGCRFTDVGIADFPDRIGSYEQASGAFAAALAGKKMNRDEYNAFLGYMFVWLGRQYAARGLVMQWHLAVLREVNTSLAQTIGPDCGGDCVGDPIPAENIAAILDAIDREGGLPQTVLYTLNSAMSAQLASLAGSFRNVRSGAAWWFCDHKRGIAEQLNTIAEYGRLGSFTGMLTDSRSFLSYARHDYFRRILCDTVGGWVENGEYANELADGLIADICYNNIRRLTD